MLNSYDIRSTSKFNLSQYILSSLSEFWGCCGLVFVALGFLGISAHISSPFNFVGGIVYVCIGIYISLTYSSRLRKTFISNLPENSRVVLYKKSLIDIWLEPSEATRALVISSICGFLDPTERRALMLTLPSNCNYLNRQGLVHLLPPVLQNMFHLQEHEIPLILPPTQLPQLPTLTDQHNENEGGMVAPNALGLRLDINNNNNNNEVDVNVNVNNAIVLQQQQQQQQQQPQQPQQQMVGGLFGIGEDVDQPIADAVTRALKVRTSRAFDNCKKMMTDSFIEMTSSVDDESLGQIMWYGSLTTACSCILHAYTSHWRSTSGSRIHQIQRSLPLSVSRLLFQKEILWMTQTVTGSVCAVGTTALIAAGAWTVSRGQTSILGAIKGAVTEFKKNTYTISAWMYRKAASLAVLCVIFIAYRMRRKIGQVSWLYAIYFNRSLARLLQEQTHNTVNVR